ncbi:conjugal transfer protein TrbL family protein [Staphylococcus shinii]|uniref:conjugal transfer protein TrbL family protein n=1 Tax=Staphylococcus shinii TaxID=2912228 RepID=UPI003F571867
MKVLKKSVLIVFLFSFIFTSLSHIAKADEKGTGVQNNLSNTSQKAYNSLPSDEELQKMVGNQNASIAQASNKKIGKGKGALYKAYGDEIDKYIKERKKSGLSSPGLKKTAQNYNTSTGKVEGKNPFDVQRHITNLGLSFGKFAIETASKPLKSFTIKPGDVLNAPSAKPMKDAFNSLTDVLLALFLIFQLSKTMVSRAIDIGHNGQAIYDKIFKTFMAAILIGLYEPIFKLILNFQYLLVTPILNSIEVNDSMAGQIALNGLLVDATGMTFMVPFVAVMLIVVTMSLFYSLAMMIILFIIGPVAITTMVNEDMEFFSLWFRKVISRVLTLMLQSLCIAMSFATLFRITFSYTETITDYLLGIAFLFVALSIPKMLENFGDSSGAGRSTMMFIRSVGRRK